MPIYVHQNSNLVTRMRIEAGVTAPDLLRLRRGLKPSGQPLCPNLRSLRIATDGLDKTATTRKVAVLAGPSLTEVILTPQHTEEDPSHSKLAYKVGSLLQLIATAAPQTTHITFNSSACKDSGCKAGRETDGRIAPKFGIFDHLRVLHLNQFSAYGWYELAECKALEELSVTKHDYAPWAAQTVYMEQVTFPSLEKLEFHRLEYTQHILFVTTMPRLRVLNVTNFVTLEPVTGSGDEQRDTQEEGEGESNTRNQNLVPVIAERSPLLEAVTLRFQSGLMRNSTLLGFAKLSKVRYLTLRNWAQCEDVTFTDKAMEKMLVSLTELRLLIIEARDDWGSLLDDMRITGRTFLAMARHCKFLAKLTIPVDLSDCMDLELPTTTPSCLALTDITLRPLMLQGKPCPPAANFLAGCCPVIQKLVVHHPGDSARSREEEAATRDFVERVKEQKADARVQVGSEYD